MSNLFLLLALALCHAAPVEDKASPSSSSSAKPKRGLHLSLGYHAPLITSSYVAAEPTAIYHTAPVLTHEPILSHAPLISHHAPVYSHASVIQHAPLLSHTPLISHAPLIAHAPIYSSSHILPSIHSIHHY
ncbi:hypothetical protein CVS40_3042 [Lucilia cuprina]|nr:hypothetical protein CVS40_3042 [Lucilia cuprina]